VMYLVGFVMFAYNIIKTVTAGKAIEQEPQFRTPMA